MPPPSSQTKLFKEYAICDLTMYKTGNIGLRWCLERDILSGKGKKICGNKHCEQAATDTDPLHSYEVNMTYSEDIDGKSEQKQALVKVNVCSECAYKLNYKKIKDKIKKKKKKHQKKDKKKKKSKRSSCSSSSEESESD